MHTTDIDISIEELSKIEGAASVELKIRGGKVETCNFSITEMRRFFTEAVRGKPVLTVPQQVARICGTCSNAHLLASTLAVEHALCLKVSPQVTLLRQLLYYGLIIRDHGLHLYVFSLPDLFNKDSILSFDENNPEEHKLLDDCFLVKEAGNRLSIATGGRSVHAPFVKPGGMTKIPTKEELFTLIPQLDQARGAVLHLISVFTECQFSLFRPTKFLALKDSNYSFLSGDLTTTEGSTLSGDVYEEHLKRVVIPHSQASGYRFDDQTYMVGALARLNINKDALHPKTKQDASGPLNKFPSANIYHNNLAQAIEMLHAIDTSIDLINAYQAKQEETQPISFKESVGYGIIEAPRGVLYHKLTIGAGGTVKHARIIVPTAQNQIGISESIAQYVSTNLDKTKEILEHEIEKIIRAYDPCMSCATHFLKVKWK